MAKILILGASRGIGLETVKAALAAGHNVRAFARSAASMQLADAKLEKFTGDALRKGDVDRALDGVDAVIVTVGIASLRELAFGTTFFSESTRILVPAMKDAGVRRLIAVTGVGAGNSRGRTNFLYDYLAFPLLLERVFRDKDIAEDVISKSGLDWTIVRPGLLTSGAFTGRYQVLTEMKDWRAGVISRADCADFLVKQVGDRALIGKTPLLVG